MISGTSSLELISNCDPKLQHAVDEVSPLGSLLCEWKFGGGTRIQIGADKVTRGLAFQQDVYKWLDREAGHHLSSSSAATHTHSTMKVAIALLLLVAAVYASDFENK